MFSDKMERGELYLILEQAKIELIGIFMYETQQNILSTYKDTALY